MAVAVDRTLNGPTEDLPSTPAPDTAIVMQESAQALTGAHLRMGDVVLFGATAEIVSVLDNSKLWLAATNRHVDITRVARALDTRRPPEERVAEAAQIAEAIHGERLLARWIPWYADLAKHEFANDFYSAYRDHSVHSLQVYLLGLYLYETVAALRSALDPRLSLGLDVQYDATSIFLEWWTLTAFWHDTGYPFEASTFLADADRRAEQLNLLTDGLGRNIFNRGLNALGHTPSRSDLRAIYQAGRYYPLSFEAVSDLLADSPGVKILHDMWQRLGVAPDADNVPAELSRLTTTSPISRPPYHDHGLLGGLLLAWLYGETERFLRNVSESTIALAGALWSLTSDLMEAWGHLTSLEGLLNLAVESIGYHNIRFADFDLAERRRLLGGHDAPQPVSLGAEPHLFFTALADTLQDWDRHHFQPQTNPSRYRPAVRAADMLLQGSGNTIRVAFSKPNVSSKDVIRLFQDWLSLNDVQALIDDGASFSAPSKIAAGLAAPTLADETASARTRARLQALIGEALQESRRLLIQGGPNAVIQTGLRINSVTTQIRDAIDLTLSDRKAVEEFLAVSGLRQTEKQAYALIEIGSKLSLGRVDCQLGFGGFGTVYRIVGDQNQFAFKLFHDRDLDVEEKRRLFRRGYQAMKALRDHPNVVTVYQFEEVPVGFYMDYIEGTDLDMGLNQLDTVQDRLEAALRIAETLDAAHSRGVLHRDVKPANVLLNSKLEPILTDFDLAHIGSKHSEQTRAVFATVSYGAPEQLDERLMKHRVKPTVDVYSFGALLYFMMTNQTPPSNGAWTHDNFDALQDRLEGRLVAVAVKGIVDLIRQATVFKPDARIQSMDEIVRRLGYCISATGRSDQAMTPHDWLAEIKYRVSGLATNVSDNIQSRTGATSWDFQSVTHEHDLISLDLLCRLNRAPSLEGVNYEGFKRGTIKQIDRRVDDLRREWPDFRIERIGQVGLLTGSMTLKIRRCPLSVKSAGALAQLLGSITRIIE